MRLRRLIAAPILRRNVRWVPALGILAYLSLSYSRALLSQSGGAKTAYGSLRSARGFWGGNASARTCASTKSWQGKADVCSWHLYQRLEDVGREADASWGPVKGEKIRLFVVPHSHVDPGWLSTFEDYYTTAVRGILNSAVEELTALPKMRFIWSEVSFLERWIQEAPPEKVAAMRKLVESGQLEIAGGAWVMTDEATPHFWATIDNMVEGQRFVRAHLGAVPRSSWSVDPFGHGLAVPLLYRLSGIHRYVLGRVHTHLKRRMRREKELDYYTTAVRGILNSAVEELTALPKMRFIWSEVSFLERWIQEAPPEKVAAMRKLVESGQLEIAGGAWVMTDEATPHFWATIDNMVEGQRFVREHLGAVPRSSWSVDPFGHGLAVPLLYRLSGIHRYVLGRVHTHLKRRMRREKELVFHWRQPWESSGGSLVSVLPNKVYITGDGCGPNDKVCCQFEWGPSNQYRCNAPKSINADNVQHYGDLLAGEYRKLASLFRTKVIFASLGADFRFKQRADFREDHDNYNALFEYFRTAHPDIDASFGTVSEYFAALEEAQKGSSDVPSLRGDFFPYTDNYPSAQWTGYMSTRMHWKVMERRVQGLLRAAYLLVSLGEASGRGEGSRALQVASRALALFQHHDGITGTSRNHVMDDYKRRLLKAWDDISALLMRTVGGNLVRANPNAETEEAVLLPEDMEGQRKRLRVVNPVEYGRRALLRLTLPCRYASVARDGEDSRLPAQLNPVMRDGALSTKEIEMEWVAELGPLSTSSFVVRCESERPAESTEAEVLACRTVAGCPKLSTGDQPLRLDAHGGAGVAVSRTTGLPENAYRKGKAFNVSASLHYWSGGSGGAYLLRPTGPIIRMEANIASQLAWRGPLSSGVLTHFAKGSHVDYALVRLASAGGAAEVELRANLLDKRRTELLLRLHCEQCKAASGRRSFLGDVTGLYLVERRMSEGLKPEANFYPASSAAAVESASGTRLTVALGQPHGASSPLDGSLDLLLSRAVNADDGEGLGEIPTADPLTPTRFSLLLEELEARASDAASFPARQLTADGLRAQNDLLRPPILLHSAKAPKDEEDMVLPEFPCHLELVTLKPLEDGRVLMVLRRLEGMECAKSQLAVCSQETADTAVRRLLEAMKVVTVVETNLSGTEDGESMSAADFNFRSSDEPIAISSHLLQF